MFGLWYRTSATFAVITRLNRLVNLLSSPLVPLARSGGHPQNMTSKDLARRQARALRLAIVRQEDALRSLERERDAAEHELRRLEGELEAPESAQAGYRLEAPGPRPEPPVTPGGKVALFRTLFRGRDDVYPKLWMNAKTGRTGYAPACANEWVQGVCGKPRVRCGECPNQAFLPVVDRAVLDHLRGHHVIGVYPLLADETCWFLAVDFDKRDWEADMAAFRQVSRSAGLPVAVERSRSGNGAHAWFFFDGPVRAATARRMGCFLITQAMSRRHGLGMSSYDRLFPNQDTLPRGGFGNLIALPLQHGPRARGNTVFVDDDFRPFADQWAYLTGLQRIPLLTVEEIAAAALRRGLVLGVRPTATEDEETAPWRLTPSRRAKLQPPELDQPLPGRVEATLAHRGCPAHFGHRRGAGGTRPRRQCTRGRRIRRTGLAHGAGVFLSVSAVGKRRGVQNLLHRLGGARDRGPAATHPQGESLLRPAVRHAARRHAYPLAQRLALLAPNRDSGSDGVARLRPDRQRKRRARLDLTLLRCRSEGYRF